MRKKEIKVDSIIKKIIKKDNLFKGDYTVDLYQNCNFGCIYCDSSYDDTVYVKINAVKILEKELEHLPRGRIIIGSVNDPYQSYEKKYMITRNVLEVIKKYNFTCHILTKSDIILRDIDLLKKINNCIVTVSIISLKDQISNFFEKNVPTVEKRFEVAKLLNKNKIYSGIAFIPFLPFIADKEISSIFEQVKKYDLNYVLYKHLELKGDQKQIFFEYIKKYNVEILTKYQTLYKDCYQPTQNYIKKIDSIFSKTSKKYNVKINI
jgi:DNA repair photolyase